jgi:fructose-specific phosphotransferase system IIA component
MNLTEILTPECIKVPLVGTDKRAAIDELIEVLLQQGRIRDSAALRDAVWHRETTRTTGIGHGLAIPHGKSGCCTGLVMAIGKLAKPIDFQSIDNRPVSLIFLLASPPDQTGPHIQVLARISRLMTRPEFRAAVIGAPSSQAIYDMIANEEKLAVK